MDKVNILLVEDEYIIAEDTKESLIGLGYHVMGIASSFDEAVTIIKTATPDIAIIDIRLKGEKTGIDLGLYIREHFKFPFIYLSSYSDKKTVDAAKESEPNAYLVKPFSEKELYTSIEIAINNFVKKATSPKSITESDSAVINDSIFIKKEYYYKKVKINDVVFICSDGNYLEILINDQKKYVIRSTFDDLLAYLPKNKFQRTHKSYVINVEYITSVSPSSVCVQNHEIPLSKRRKDEFMKNMNLFS